MPGKNATHAGGQSGLRQLQAQYSDRLLSVLTVLLLLLMFVVAPFQAAGIIIFEAFGVIVGLVMRPLLTLYKQRDRENEMSGIGDWDWGCNTLQIRPSVGARRLSSEVARCASARSCVAD